MVVCRYFLEGRCTYGEQCRNEHPDDTAYEPVEHEDYHQDNQSYHRGYRGSRGGYRPRSQNYTRYPGPRGNANWEPRGGFRGGHTSAPIRYEPPSTFHPPVSAAQAIQPSSDVEILDDVLLDAKNMLNDTARSDLVFQSGKIWPFSVYTYCSPEGLIRTDPLFGLEDYSPEELRAMAMAARSDPANWNEYVNGMMQQSSQNRNILLELCKACSNVNSNEARAVISEVHAKAAQNKVRRELPSFSSLQNFGSVPAVETGSSQERPVSEQSVHSHQPSGIYSDTSMLTPDDFYQFASPEFTQGKVPYRPPPRSLC